MAPDSENPNFEDESFDLSELDDSSGNFVVFLHDGIIKVVLGEETCFGLILN